MRAHKFFAVSFTMICLHVFSPALARAANDTVKPVRYATIKIKISKGTYTKNSSGSYDLSVILVCQQSSQVPVIDMRGSTNGNQDSWPRIECESTVGAQKVLVTSSNFVLLARILDPWSQKLEDTKHWTTSLDVSWDWRSSPPPATNDLQQGLYSVIATKDLSLKSLLTTIYPTSAFVQCTANPPTPSPSSNSSSSSNNTSRFLQRQNSIGSSQNCTAPMTEFFFAEVQLEDTP